MRRVLLFLALFPASALFAETIAEPNGVTIEVTYAGKFSIQSSALPAGERAYSGTIPGQVTSLTGPVRGSDNNAVSTNGPFDQFTVNYSDPEGNPWRMEIRAYRSRPSATIAFSPLADVSNRRPYAILQQYPITPHHFSNGGWNRMFGLIGWMDTDSPWLFFDDQLNASILSTLSRPMSERQVWVNDGSEYGVIALEIDAGNAKLPAGDVYSHLITFGQGVGKTFNSWGWTLRNIDGRPYTSNQADLSLIMPMLSTDAGATYYYVFNPALGYEGTLSAAIESAKAAGIPIGVVHFDSWWYLKGGNCSDKLDISTPSWENTQNGVWEFVADPVHFSWINPSHPQYGFIQTLGPGMAHGRWIDPCSPYRLTRPVARGRQIPPRVSGNVLVDPGAWQGISDALKRSGMIIYEQDFLSTNARASNTFDDEKFLNAMSAAMASNHIDLQFCMPLARHLLEAIQMPHVHTLRVSGDKFGWNHWDSEMYGAIVLNAGSVWPTVDNFKTTEARNLLLAVLSGGPLALSDPIGGFVPIPQAIRNDGLILKPDVAMVPTDASFVAEAHAMEQYYGISGQTASDAGNKSTLPLPPLVAHTYSSFGSSKVEYVFAYSRDLNAVANVNFSPQDFGLSGEVYVYDYFGKAGWRQPAGQSITRSVDSDGSYFVIAPIDSAGLAFLGDLSRFSTASKQRFSSLADNGQITATVEFTPGETVPISVFAGSEPIVTLDGAALTAPAYDSNTGLYQFDLTAGQNRQASVRIAPHPPQ